MSTEEIENAKQQAINHINEAISNNAKSIISRIILAVMVTIGLITVLGILKVELPDAMIGVFMAAITGFFAFGGNIISLLRPPAAQLPATTVKPTT